MPSEPRPPRLVVVSNRLPVAVERPERGPRRIVPGGGGLVRALGPVLRNRGGRWIGWLGAQGVRNASDLLERGGREIGYELVSVPLNEDEIAKYYRGFANEILWPLFHDLLGHCNFDPAYWPVYRKVNRKFARVVAQETNKHDFVWIQDYHLMLAAQELRELGVERQTAFFLHIPFPPLDIFVKLPWRRTILEGLLQFDLLGFQTVRDRRNFLQCVRALLPESRVLQGHSVITIRAGERRVRVGSFPVSIDFRDFVERAQEPPVVQEMERLERVMPGRVLVLGVDRLDYSKGIPERILAFAHALERYPEMRGRVTFLQVVVPSRTRVAEYRQLKDDIDRLVGTVNGRFTHAGWTPIQYVFRRLEESELLAYYRKSQVALITPLKDGMNLVSKEYCACNLEQQGVLILSEFAGAAAQLHSGALLVNPFDRVRTADAIRAAVWMESNERRRRMRRLRRIVGAYDIYRWVDSFLQAAIEKKLTDFPEATMPDGWI